MLSNLISLEALGGEYRKFAESVRSGQPAAAFGMSFSQRLLTVCAMQNALYVFADEVAAKKAYDTACQMTDCAVYIPPRDEVLLFKKNASWDNLRKRTAAYAKLLQDKPCVAITSVQALLQKLFVPEFILENSFTLKKGDRIDISLLAQRLVKAGYKYCDSVLSGGEFSVRGDIVDIFAADTKLPVRLDFFDTEIERIKTFDPSTQLSEDEVQSIRVVPASDAYLSPQDVTAVRSYFGALKNDRVSPDAALRRREIIGEIEGLLERNPNSPMLSYALPFMQKTSTLLDYLKADTTIVFDEPKQITDRLDALYREHMTRFEGLFASGEALPDTVKQYITMDTLKKKIAEKRKACFQIAAYSNRLFLPQKIFTFRSGSVVKYHQNIKDFENDLKNWVYTGYSVLIMGGETTAENIARQLRESGITVQTAKESVLQPGITVCEEELDSGLILHENKIVVVGTYDIISRKRNVVKRKKKTDVFIAPEVGDYVVHEIHGIGICRGIKQLDGQFGLKDFVTVEYNGGDMLYVPIDQMDLLSRYSGEESPRLSRIGGREFERLKQKVKESIRDMAIDLYRLYAERNAQKGFAFSPDTAYQAEFEEKFPFTETEDQLRATAEIKRDMESQKAMDRLLCGDVGYGKTEVAFRAMFKAVMDGKQVAMLSPTTILSEQHYHTALKRFEGFAVNIAVLNRFKSVQEVKKTLAAVAEGKVDILIGTHRLLSEDVRFRDLGLLVIDEEQRFGVEHKEKIKALKSDIDVLSLSATPIPRTLHMSMVGIRDISVLETPPLERLPIQSYILEETDAVVADALRKELARGGQSFVMINRVERIASVASHIMDLVPEAKVITAHGRMTEKALEDAVYSFYNNESDIMVCTSIIENGIDLPNANTLVVLDSDKLGLSQMYQLRGRVGRSNRIAYCYFTFRQGKVLSETAYKRLSAIMELKEFGSGFKIAMRDLEIRGAGDVLGYKQHGHMDKVGYDMYVKLLKECIDDLKGVKTESVQTTIDAELPAFIDEAYIPDEEARMRVYRRIAETESFEEREKLREELSDIYGAIPVGVSNLIDVALIKKLASGYGAESVVIKRAGAGIHFADARVLREKSVVWAIQKMSDQCVLSVSDKPSVIFKTSHTPPSEIAENMLNFLKFCKTQ